MFNLLATLLMIADSNAMVCAPPKLKYRQIVEVINKDSFYFKCRGFVYYYDSICEYLITDVCGGDNFYFKENELKFIKNHEN